MPVTVWQFFEAPEPLQKLSMNGGDEDYIILADTAEANVVAENIAERLRVCDYSAYPHPDDPTRIVYITCHA